MFLTSTFSLLLALPLSQSTDSVGRLLNKLLSTPETPPCPSESKGRTNLWRVRTEPPSYFFATLHVPVSRLWDGISETSKAAFLSSDKLLVELDISDPETVLSVVNCQLLLGTSLTEMLPGDILQRLRDHLAWVRRNMSSWLSQQQKLNGFSFSSISANWERKRPVWMRKQVNDIYWEILVVLGLVWEYYH